METILYVEDHPDNQKLVRRVLESVGYRVLIAEDGYSVTERLLDTTAFRKAPIILLWAGVSRNRPSSFMGQHVIPKPIDIDVLLETVPHLLAENVSE